ncbi:PHP domain-containing protein [Anaerolentibacter hominis]|uniref:PHP domain-containing protein n=1 Tax=Anaerolentibacter hominis TaxID=3079009 RepID=UPI0031B801AE
MAELAYDLHMHSCLSPCGSEDMTPANIAGMSALKGLDVIALTDHNTCRNCPAVIENAKQYDILVIPGMELNTVEEVHVVCLFPELKAAMEFDSYVYEQLQAFPNNEEIFGRQDIYNEKDERIGTEPNLLINATNIAFDDVYDLVHSYDGIMIPAHVDKNANSLLSNLGFVPPDSRFRCVEIKDAGKTKEILLKNPYLGSCCVVHDSDAHYLEDISEREHFLTAEKEGRSILKALIHQVE